MEVKTSKIEETTNGLQLCTISVNQDYLTEWNEHLSDFLLLARNGKPLRHTLYRVGGLSTQKIENSRYFMLLKYKEAYYSDEFLKMYKVKDPKHLESKWVIIDSDGNERIEFDNNLHYPYLVKNSCIYKLNNHYYNIETGEDYGYTSSTIESNDFLFLDNRLEKDKSKCGVLKVSKKDGTFELFNN